MTTVTSGDKRIDKYDDEKRQDGDYLLTKVNKTNVFLLFSHKCDMGREHASREKKCSMVIFFIFVHKNVIIELDSKRSKSVLERVLS